MFRWFTAEVTRVRVFERDIAIRRVHLTTLILAVAVAAVVAFAGGLFTGHYIWKPTQQQIRASCPPNRAQMGCVVKLYAQHNHVKAKDPSGPHFPDVSSWQGHPDWAAAKPSIAGAVVKAFEYRQDPDFTYNASELTRLHVPWGAYLFVRGCSYAPAFASTVRPWIAHIRVLVLDMEVPAARGCAPHLAGVLHQDFPTVRIVVYSSPGAYPGGLSAGLDVWVAAYGPSHPPCLFTCHIGPSTTQTILGWQLTDGTYGFRIYTPGIGYGDESLNYGMFTAKPHRRRVSYAIFPLKPVRLFGQKVSERLTVIQWDRKACRTPARRAYCRLLHKRLSELQGRIDYVAHHPLYHGKATYYRFHRGARRTRIHRRLTA